MTTATVTETVETTFADLRVADFVWQSPASRSFRVDRVEQVGEVIVVRSADLPTTFGYFAADDAVRVVRS
jgi:hypothetical protein